MGESRTESNRKNKQAQRARESLFKDGLLGFQRQFCEAIGRVNNPPSVAILSCPRASGKSWLAGRLLARGLDPDDPLHTANAENLLVASSRSQSEITLEFCRESASDTPNLRWSSDGAINTETRARVKILSSDSRRSLGRGHAARLIVCDEPSSWAPTSGRRLWDGLVTSLGKGERRATVVAIGTIAPAAPDSWWPQLVAAGSDVAAGVHVQLLQADADKWADWSECLRVNPATSVNRHLEEVLRREHASALKSERAAVPYRQFRLNLPARESTGEQELLSDAEWSRLAARRVPDRVGRPIVALDLGSTRSWSACASLWPDSNRLEAWALAPGMVSIGDQERRDQLPEDSYRELVTAGGLAVDEENSVPRISMLLSRIWQWEPTVICCDNHRADELRQEVAGRCKIIERGSGEVAGNIQAMRSRLLDSECGVTESSKALLAAAFKEVVLRISATGETRIEKRDRRRSRDDVVQAVLLACGHAARRPAPVQLRAAHVSREGAVTWL